jgi:Fe-S cluster assembly protein SufD
VTEAAILPLTRPSNRDEDWRYADAAFLAEADVTQLVDWRVLDVPAGETRQEIRTVLPGDGPGGAVDRLRVHVGKDGRFEMFAINAGAS